MQENKTEFESHFFGELSYQRLTKDLGEELYLCWIKEERKLLGKFLVFPHIQRVYKLKKGIKRLFKNQSFFAEEKLDGYNVRLFSHDGRIYALSRGGFICPFTTEWAEIWAEWYGIEDFFRDFPSYVICAEVVGDNPYNKQRDPSYPSGAFLYVFEIIDKQGRFLPPEQRYQLVERYNLPSVSVIGKFVQDQITNLYSELRNLNDKGSEGVVLKSLDAQKFLKFVTSISDLEDIKDGMPVSFDLPSGYFNNRILRACIFIQELGLDEEEYARKLGKAFMQGCPLSDSFQESSETYLIYVQRKKTWEELYNKLSQQVRIRCNSIEQVALYGRQMLRVVFQRIYKKSSKRYYRILQGFLHTD